MMNPNNEHLFQEIHLYLCDHAPRPKIMGHIQIIKEQLKRQIDKYPWTMLFASNLIVATCVETQITEPW